MGSAGERFLRHPLLLGFCNCCVFITKTSPDKAEGNELRKRLIANVYLQGSSNVTLCKSNLINLI